MMRPFRKAMRFIYTCKSNGRQTADSGQAAATAPAHKGFRWHQQEVDVAIGYRFRYLRDK